MVAATPIMRVITMDAWWVPSTCGHMADGREPRPGDDLSSRTFIRCQLERPRTAL